MRLLRARLARGGWFAAPGFFFRSRLRTAGPPLALSACLAAGPVAATGTYMTPETFLAQSFPTGVPQSETIWLRGELAASVRDILDHPYGRLRVRYWAKAGRSAWILDEIGKELPITVGVVVDSDRIEHVEVLVFRETRGWEVRSPAFTGQFTSARLAEDNRLDRHIDGITGATLSVRALTRLARVALFLHNRIVFPRIETTSASAN